MLRCPVFFMAGLYRGKNKYHVVFERDRGFFGQTLGGSRDAGGARGDRALCRAARSILPQRSVQLVQFLRFLAPAAGEYGASNCARRTCILLVGALAALSAAAMPQPAASELDEVMGLLAMRQHGRVEFVEQQFLARLESADRVLGRVALRRTGPAREAHAQTACRNVAARRRHVDRRAGTAVACWICTRIPQVQPFVESIRATLAGDRGAWNACSTSNLPAASHAGA